MREYILRALLEDDNVFTTALQRDWPDGDDPLFTTALGDLQRITGKLLTRDWPGLFAPIGLEKLCQPGRPSLLARQRAYTGGFAESLAHMLSLRQAAPLLEAMAVHLRRYGSDPWAGHRAYSWKDNALTGVNAPDLMTFDDLLEIDYQKEALIHNTRDFLQGRPANNVLLCGSMGSGKTSCIKALMTEFQEENLRIVAVQRSELHSLDALLGALSRQAPRYIVFLDDLSFDEDDLSYSRLKTALDGDLARPPQNVLFYATSNRRNIVRESWHDRDGGEIHSGDSQAEKQSLAERFGIKLFFGRYGQAEYFAMIAHGLAHHGLEFDETAQAQAVEWERNFHARSGRSAANFIKHYVAEKG